MQRPQGPKPPKKGEFVFADSDWRSAWPLLCQGLGDPWWDDGKPRNPWTLKLAFDAEAVVVTINDKDSKLVCFTTAPDVKAAFDAIEEALQGGGLSWRKSKY